MSSLTAKKCAYYARQFVLKKKNRKRSINGAREAEGSEILHYDKPHLVNANKCRMPIWWNANMQLQRLSAAHRYSVLTVFSGHRVCVLWNSSYIILCTIQSLVAHCHTLRLVSFLGECSLTDRAFKHHALENRKLKQIRIESYTQYIHI